MLDTSNFIVRKHKVLKSYYTIRWVDKDNWIGFEDIKFSVLTEFEYKKYFGDI